MSNIKSNNSKQCNTCDKIKPFSEFHRSKITKSGLTGQCKECRNKVISNHYWRNEEESKRKAREKYYRNHDYYEQYYIDNAEAIKKQRKKYGNENKELISKRSKNYRSRNPEKFRERAKRYYQQNKDECKQRAKEYNKKNSTKVKKKNKIYTQKRKIETLDLIGNGVIECSNCGYNDQRFLDIDHIDPSLKCRKKEKGGLSQYILRNKNDISDFQILCGNCNWLKEVKRRKGKLHSKKYQKNRIRESKHKKTVLNYYSNKILKCACCGFNEYDALQIDHTKGNGAQERRKKDIPSKGGRPFYRWLMRNNFPPAYQVLCAMCNHAKRDTDKCPHQESQN